VVTLFEQAKLAAKIFSAHQAAILLGIGNLISLGQDAVVSNHAKASAIRAAAQVSGVG
jgi:hypothetical protein